MTISFPYSVVLILVISVGSIHEAAGQSFPDRFTYQGRLDQEGAEVTEVCNFHFSVWNDLTLSAPAN